MSDKAQLFGTYWNMLAPLDLEQPVSEYNFDKLLKRKHRFDWCFKAAHVAVEVDGGRWLAHGGRHATDADREKLNIAASLRYLVFRYSPEMLEADPHGCVDAIADVVRSRQ